MDNLFRDAPTGPTFAVSSGNYNVAQLREEERSYRQALVKRVSRLSTQVGQVLRPELMYSTEAKPSYNLWNLELIEQLPTAELRNLTVLVENTEEILKGNPKLLSYGSHA